MTDGRRRVLVAGTAGGVGTTTVTALLFSAWPGRAGVPRLADHTGGTLGLRLAEGDEVGRLDDDVVLVDAGAGAFGVAGGVLDARARLVLVTAATPVGCGLADRCLLALRAELGADTRSDVLSRTVLVMVGVFGRRRLGRSPDWLAERNPELAATIMIPPDLALAAGGRIPLPRLSRRTRQGVEELADLVSGLPTVSRVRVSG